jgi:hypothetical protein
MRRRSNERELMRSNKQRGCGHVCRKAVSGPFREEIVGLTRSATPRTRITSSTTVMTGAPGRGDVGTPASRRAARSVGRAGSRFRASGCLVAMSVSSSGTWATARARAQERADARSHQLHELDKVQCQTILTMQRAECQWSKGNANVA